MIRYNPKINEGLNYKQVNYRKNNNCYNKKSDIKTKSISEIVLGNIFTLFNIINIFLGILIFIVGSYKNLLFLGVVFFNTLISIIQELRSKFACDKLSIISSTKASVIREGKNEIINIYDVVLDDIIIFKRGNQVIADAIILEGVVDVNESLLSGEENIIVKHTGDILYSGSFIVGGKCTCKVEKVGENSYASKITKDAKKYKKINSEIMNTLNKVIKIISIIIVPLGILLFLRQYNLVNNNIENSIINTVAAIIGMIPEGLVLLTSTVLAISILRLTKKNVLVKQLYCIETLARVDTLCIDKTGTLTEGKMEVFDVVKLASYDYVKILSLFTKVFDISNPTMEAISKKFNCDVDVNYIEKEEFTSEKKYSSITVKDNKYTLGAPDILDNSIEMKNLIEKYSDYRLLLLKCEKENIALILLNDKIRYNALNTLNYLRSQNVDIKIISGDNENVIKRVAKRVGFNDLKCIDMSLNKTNKIDYIAENYNIFSRVSPMDKKKLIASLKKNGHTVAMIGDGVNDVLALREADCSIAISSGSSAARTISEIVLVDSDFASIPKIIEEGRRTINNVEKSSSLFLTKTIYSTLLLILFLFVPMNYPFEPIQLSLISSLTIGIPAFILSLEPNKNKISGNFFLNILKCSLPGGITIVINVITVLLFSKIFNMNNEEISTLSVYLVSITSFILLYKVCYKFNILRFTLFITLIILFFTCIIGLPFIFELVSIKKPLIFIILLIFVLDIGLFNLITDICCKKLFKYKDKIIY